MDYAVFNPKNQPELNLPIIYAFNNGGRYADGNVLGVLISESGFLLGSHVCSNESFMLKDLGVLSGSREDRHETFREFYPNGYRMEFVSEKDVENHEGLQKALDFLADRTNSTEELESR